MSTPRSRCAWRNSPCWLKTSSMQAGRAVYLAVASYGIHADAAFEMPVARLVVLVKLKSAGGRSQMSAGLGGKRKPACRVECALPSHPAGNRIAASLAVPVRCGTRLWPPVSARQLIARELGVLRMQADRVAGARRSSVPRRAIRTRMPCLRIERGARGAAGCPAQVKSTR